MGGGSWSTDVYSTRSATRAKTGESAFAYDKQVQNLPVEKRVTHVTLDPKDTIREARDSDDHPLSVPVAVFFDVTGSMGHLPVLMQANLPTLVEGLQTRAFVEDGQILIGAIGDAHMDKGSIQVGQFEADNRIEDHLGNMWLEGGGGGNGGESYDLALYYAARHIVTDAWEKRGEKGYLFLTGDDHCFPIVKAKQVEALFGEELDADLPISEIVAEVKERWHVFFLVPCSNARQGLIDGWKKMLGAESVLELSDANGLADLIADTVRGLEEAKRATPI